MLEQHHAYVCWIDSYTHNIYEHVGEIDSGVLQCVAHPIHRPNRRCPYHCNPTNPHRATAAQLQAIQHAAPLQTSRFHTHNLTHNTSNTPTESHISCFLLFTSQPSPACGAAFLDRPVCTSGSSLWPLHATHVVPVSQPAGPGLLSPNTQLSSQRALFATESHI